MSSLLDLLAQGMHSVLPDFVRLPNLTFELPHLAYWSGLIVLPLVASYLVSREARHAAESKVSTPIAWLLWFWGGFVGLHRFYLRASRLGFVYILLFAGVLHGNIQIALAREGLSSANNDLLVLAFDIERFQAAAAQGRAGAEASLAAAREGLAAVQAKLVAAQNLFGQWEAFSGGLAAIILIMLAADAIMMGRLARRCREKEPPAGVTPEIKVMERGPGFDPRREIHTPTTMLIDTISGFSGTFVAYWSVIAVFVYYYEVIARYVFNSPTNWAHESMFLMFGMQYLLSGAYAYREDAHVRVDVIYERFSFPNRALIDVITSAFFFVFTATFLVTGTIFAMDAIDVWEVSFTEWAIQYWPVKLSIGVGAFLLLLQGIAKLIRDVAYFRGRRA